MSGVQVVFPKPVVYYIERYKFEVCLAYAVIGITLLVLLQSVMLSLQYQESNAASYVDSKYPIVNMSVAAEVQPAVSTESIWPFRGIVTTEFGASDRPYQTSHTGIDISSARPAGTTPISPFREGTVVQVIHSNVSYGNYVVIDHGTGLTSLYGHLANTTVSKGQRVVPGDTLGREGSTGASTGPHVHFEIILNGSPVNPRRYITGNP